MANSGQSDGLGEAIMWHTSSGDRILSGAEAKLFKAALTGLVEETMLSDCDFCGCGIELFDELTSSQRLAVLEGIATSLLTDTVDMPNLTAVNESAVAAVFEYARFEVELEIDDCTAGTTWRQMVFDSYHECFANESGSDSEHCCPAHAGSDCRTEWHSAVESLADRVLWDRDFEMVGSFLDEPPEKAAMMRQVLGIDDDYFSAAADDFTTRDAAEQSIGRLTRILQ